MEVRNSITQEDLFEEWNNLAYNKNYFSLIQDFRNKIPKNPIPYQKNH